MNFVTILTVAIIFQNQKVFCDDIFKPVTSFFTTTFKELFQSFSDMIRLKRPKFVILPLKQRDERQADEQIKQSFNEFIAKTATELETDVSYEEYAKLRSEPTVLMSTPQLVTYHGRRVETHLVRTRDGYLLTLHRILPLSQHPEKSASVILHHGLLGSSADWILLGRNKSLPYLLSNVEYDVWMVNARGNYYSRGHISIPVKSPRYWQFSFQEMGEHDLPAVIDYIRALKNGTSKINYIAHSMGATAFLIFLSTAPQYNRYIRMGILMAPLAFMTSIREPLHMIWRMLGDPPYRLLTTVGSTEFLPNRKVPEIISKRFCNEQTALCRNPQMFLSGSKIEKSLNASFIARLLYHVPAGGSARTIMHYWQLIKSGNFHRFNKEYSEYPLHKITSPTVLIYSNDDMLVPITDVIRLYFSLANPLDQYIIYDRNMSHNSFVWGPEAETLVFAKVLEYLKSGITQGNIVKT